MLKYIKLLKLKKQGMKLKKIGSTLCEDSLWDKQLV